MKHRNCKRRVDAILATNSYHVGAADIQILMHEVEDVREERDELLRRAGDVIEVWDERGVPDKDDDGLKNALEQLRDCLPFSDLRSG